MALTEDEQEKIEALATSLVGRYGFVQPPVPVEHILSHPPEGLSNIDISDLSLVFGIGEHRYEYRMAIARLLYREICRVREPSDPLPYDNEAARLFAISLLAPTAWLQQATKRPFVTLQQLSEEFQVPDFALASRLTHLGTHLKGMS